MECTCEAFGAAASWSPSSLSCLQSVFYRHASDPQPAPLYARYAKWAKAPEVGANARASKDDEDEEEGEGEVTVGVVPAPPGSLGPTTHERHGKGCRGPRIAGTRTPEAALRALHRGVDQVTHGIPRVSRDRVRCLRSPCDCSVRQ